MSSLSIRLSATLTALVVALSVGGHSGAAESDAVGRIAVEIRNVRIEKTATAYRFVHDRAFVESGGVGVTLTQGQVCFASGLCNGQPVNYRIGASQTLVRENAVIEPLGPEETFAYMYTGKDDNGHVVRLLFSIVVSGDQYKVTP